MSATGLPQYNGRHVTNDEVTGLQHDQLSEFKDGFGPGNATTHHEPHEDDSSNEDTDEDDDSGDDPGSGGVMRGCTIRAARTTTERGKIG